mgnify:CR=1 FL=1
MCKPLQERCQKLLEDFGKKAGDKKEIYLISTPHVTMSLTSPLRHHFIEPFLQALRDRLKYASPFTLAFDLSRFQIFRNDAGDRFFSAVSVSAGESEGKLQAVVEAVDEVASRFGTSSFLINF